MTEHEQQDPGAPEDEAVEESRAGGDGAAAGTVAEREAVARGDDHLFGEDADEGDEPAR